MNETILRNFDDHVNYNIHKKIVHEMMGSSTEYIQALIFDPFEPWCSLTLNKFPYKGMERKHYVMWIGSRYHKFWGVTRVQRMFPDENVFENSDEHKSIPGVLHYHVCYS
jgi:hypothetical protein